MVNVETHRGFRITVGAVYGPRSVRYAIIGEIDGSRVVEREDVPGAIPIEAVFEACRRRIDEMVAEAL